MRILVGEARGRQFTPCWADSKTECITEIISVFFVNFFMPRKPLSCWRAIVMAAPAIKPTIAAWDRKSIKKPNLKITKRRRNETSGYLIIDEAGIAKSRQP